MFNKDWFFDPEYLTSVAPKNYSSWSDYYKAMNDNNIIKNFKLGQPSMHEDVLTNAMSAFVNSKSSTPTQESPKAEALDKTGNVMKKSGNPWIMAAGAGLSFFSGLKQHKAEKKAVKEYNKRIDTAVGELNKDKAVLGITNEEALSWAERQLARSNVNPDAVSSMYGQKIDSARQHNMQLNEAITKLNMSKLSKPKYDFFGELAESGIAGKVAEDLYKFSK